MAPHCLNLKVSINGINLQELLLNFCRYFQATVLGSTTFVVIQNLNNFFFEFFLVLENFEWSSAVK